jgi:hypothetical protein
MNEAKGVAVALDVNGAAGPVHRALEGEGIANLDVENGCVLSPVVRGYIFF